MGKRKKIFRLFILAPGREEWHENTLVVISTIIFEHFIDHVVTAVMKVSLNSVSDLDEIATNRLEMDQFQKLNFYSV